MALFLKHITKAHNMKIKALLAVSIVAIGLSGCSLLTSPQKAVSPATNEGAVEVSFEVNEQLERIGLEALAHTVPYAFLVNHPKSIDQNFSISNYTKGSGEAELTTISKARQPIDIRISLLTSISLFEGEPVTKLSYSYFVKNYEGLSYKAMGTDIISLDESKHTVDLSGISVEQESVIKEDLEF